MRRRLAQLTDTEQLATSLIWDDGDCTIQNRERGSHCASEARRHDCIQRRASVTKKIVRPRKIILGQKVAMKFAPINVRPCQILSREGSHHDGGVQKAVARPSGSRCETQSKWIASECAEKILWSRHVCT